MKKKTLSDATTGPDFILLGLPLRIEIILMGSHVRDGGMNQIALLCIEELLPECRMKIIWTYKLINFVDVLKVVRILHS